MSKVGKYGATGALIGAGLGAASGFFGDKEGRGKRMARNALIGGAIGATGGGLAGMGSANPPKTENKANPPKTENKANPPKTENKPKLETVNSSHGPVNIDKQRRLDRIKEINKGLDNPNLEAMSNRASKYSKHRAKLMPYPMGLDARTRGLNNRYMYGGYGGHRGVITDIKREGNTNIGKQIDHLMRTGKSPQPVYNPPKIDRQRRLDRLKSGDTGRKYRNAKLDLGSDPAEKARMREFYASTRMV